MIKHSIDCWEVYTSYDRDTSHVAYFETEALASQFMSKDKNRNYMGKQRVRKNYVIFENLEEVAQYSKENLRKSALAKLSDLEIEALGIKV
jgi:hypothetical protein